MKWAMLALISTLYFLFSVFAFATPSGLITLAWEYPSNLISPDLGFVITASTNLSAPLTNWPVIVCTGYTNCITTNYDGANFEFRQKFQMQPGAMFFVCYPSNFWGLGGTSNIASTPPLPVPVYQTITRTN